MVNRAPRFVPPQPPFPIARLPLRVHLFLFHRVPLGHTMGMSRAMLVKTHARFHPWG